jgi:hypothetical protein
MKRRPFSLLKFPQAAPKPIDDPALAAAITDLRYLHANSSAFWSCTAEILDCFRRDVEDIVAARPNPGGAR